MVAKFYGRSISLDFLRNKSECGKEGVSLLGLADAAERIGLKSVAVRLSFEQLVEDAPLPAILFWDQFHFVVLTPASNKRKLVIADPAKGLTELTKDEFLKRWLSTAHQGEHKGIALLLETTVAFDEADISATETASKKIGWRYFFSFARTNKAYLIQVLLGLLIGSFLQLLFPYLTQSIVDTGINTQDLSFIQIVLTAQLMLLFSQTAVEFIRSRILLHVSTKINLTLLSGFWSKLLRLPMHFFDSRHPGDIIQRIGDHHRIETVLTGSAMNTMFSLLSLCLFSMVLLSYNVSVFIIFAVGSILYLLWIQFFLKYRRRLDYKRFAIASQENNATMQLVYGIQEIKLNSAENTYRWQWENLQAGLFKLNFKSLSLSQVQQVGAFFINQGKNILITFIVSKLVIEGQLTLGMMLAIQYIIGQLNSPVEQLIGFSQQAQDAKISFDRLNDIHVLEDEEPLHKHFNHSLPPDHGLIIKDLSFAYPGAGNEPVLKNISLEIPKGKVTAIVGMSGSGKTTLLKLLLRFYENYSGDIFIGSSNFKTISPRYWRSVSGCVMQDSFIFNDNIQKNITVSGEKTDHVLLINACRTATFFLLLNHCHWVSIQNLEPREME
jgi:ATP-binding cassette, subfamily B, bacterial